MVTQLDPGQAIKGAYDEAHNALQVSIVNGSITASNPSVGPNGSPIPVQSTELGAKDGSGNLQPLNITAGGALKTDSSATTQPVSASALPLPAGASTSANQATANTSLSSIDGKIVTVNTGNVVVSSSALPTGAATSSLQSTANTSLSSIDTKTPALVTGRVPVDGSGVTQPVSASSLPLPTGASTEATLSSLNGKVVAVNTGAVVISSGSISVSNFPVTQPVSAASLPLPSNASQETGGNLAALASRMAGALVPTAFDYISLTYVPSGNGVGQVQTASYKTGGSGGTLVATLTLAYDSSNRVSSVTKT